MLPPTILGQPTGAFLKLSIGLALLAGGVWGALSLWKRAAAAAAATTPVRKPQAARGKPGAKPAAKGKASAAKAAAAVTSASSNFSPEVLAKIQELVAKVSAMEQRSDHAKAEETCRALLDLLDKNNAPLLMKVAAQLRLVKIQVEQDRLAPAVDMLLTLHADLSKADGRTGSTEALADTSSQLADLLLRLDRLPESEKYCLQAIKLLKELPSRRGELAVVYWNTGLLFARQRNYEKAVGALKKSIALLSAIKSPYFKMTLLVRSTLAGVQFDMGSKEDATVAWAGIMTDLRKHYGVAKELTAVFLPYSRLIVRALFERGLLSVASEVLERSIALVDEIVKQRGEPRQLPGVYALKSDQATIARSEGRFADAQALETEISEYFGSQPPLPGGQIYRPPLCMSKWLRVSEAVIVQSTGCYRLELMMVELLPLTQTLATHLQAGNYVEVTFDNPADVAKPLVVSHTVADKKTIILASPATENFEVGKAYAANIQVYSSSSKEIALGTQKQFFVFGA
jgi:tetratricopeptide (TPR) repeat protein